MKDRVKVISAVALQEGAYDKSTGKATITVIKPGFNTSKKRFYQEAGLKRDHKIFEGSKMFVNHATSAEEKSRPEGDVNQWVGNITRTWTEADGTIKGEAAIIDPAFRAKMDNLAEAKLLGEMGVSIRAIGEAYQGKVDGHDTTIVEGFIAARSVDFVTYPGAGGRVEAIESDSSDANDVDLITEAQLRNRRPDLVQLVEAKIKGETEGMKTLEQVTAELTESTRLLTEEKAKNATLTTQVEESGNKEKKAVAAAELTRLLTESKLPEKAQVRLKAQFKDALKVEGMAEAVKAEKEYVESFLPKGKGVTGMGADSRETAEPTDEEKAATKKQLKESFILMGSTPEEAEIAASK